MEVRAQPLEVRLAPGVEADGAAGVHVRERHLPGVFTVERLQTRTQRGLLKCFAQGHVNLLLSPGIELLTVWFWVGRLQLLYSHTGGSTGGNRTLYHLQREVLLGRVHRGLTVVRIQVEQVVT